MVTDISILYLHNYKLSMLRDTMIFIYLFLPYNGPKTHTDG